MHRVSLQNAAVRVWVRFRKIGRAGRHTSSLVHKGRLERRRNVTLRFVAENVQILIAVAVVCHSIRQVQRQVRFLAGQRHRHRLDLSILVPLLGLGCEW